MAAVTQLRTVIQHYLAA